MKTLMGLITGVFLFVCLFCASPASSLPADLSFNGSLFSADLKDVSLREVLKRLKDERGIDWEGDPAALEEKITVRFSDLSLHQGMRRVLSGMNYSLVFDADKRLIDVVIIGKMSSTGAVTRDGPLFKRRSLPRRERHAENTTDDAFKVIRNISPPGGEAKPSKEVLKNFEVKRNLPPPGGPVKATAEQMESFKVIRNIAPPGSSGEVSKEVLESFKVRMNVPPPGN